MTRRGRSKSNLIRNLSDVLEAGKNNLSIRFILPINYLKILNKKIKIYLVYF